MKLLSELALKRRRQEGGWLLVVIAILALVAFVLYVGYKVITHLIDHPIDPNHGHDPDEDEAVAAWIQETEAQYGPIHIEVGGVSLPAEALARDWGYTVETSTNLVDWTEVPLEWNQITNDLSKPVIFYRMILTTD